MSEYSQAAEQINAIDAMLRNGRGVYMVVSDNGYRIEVDDGGDEETAFTGSSLGVAILEAAVQLGYSVPESSKAEVKFRVGARVRSTIELETYEGSGEGTHAAGWLGTVYARRENRFSVEMDGASDCIYSFDKNTDAVEVVDE